MPGGDGFINELAAQSENDCYSVLAIAVEDSRAAVTQYAKESKLVFPVALDLNSTVKRAYRIFDPPATFFIDGQGIIRDIMIGPTHAGTGIDSAQECRYTKMILYERRLLHSRALRFVTLRSGGESREI